MTTTASLSSEPTIANDRNGVIATGNFFAYVSGDDGLTFPTDLKPYGDQIYGGFCCDQVAYAVDRDGPSSLLFWLRQYRYTGKGSTDDDALGGLDGGNALHLRLYRGRDDLLDGSDSCNWILQPQEDFDFDEQMWFDFNHLDHTPKYLYLTTNVRDEGLGASAKATDGPRVGALIVRFALDDIDDGNCQLHYDYWYRDGDVYLTPVQNAGSTMYIAANVVAEDYTSLNLGNESNRTGKKLTILSFADSAGSYDEKTKNIKNYESDGYSCRLPNQDDNICGDVHPGRASGFRSGNTVGWMWTAAQDNQHPFPYVRVEILETGSLEVLTEHDIWNSGFAFMYGFAGVNESGDVGVLLYQIGGGHYPTPQGFIRTNPSNWDGITTHFIASAVGTPVCPKDDDGKSDCGWGHYAQVLPYGGCENTFVGMAWVMQQGPTEAEGRDSMVWFGDEDDGCADLAVTLVQAGNGAPFDPGETMHAISTIRNQGSGLAVTSKVAYYLSRDDVKDDGDIRLGDHTIGHLDAGAAIGDAKDIVMPSLFLGAAGDYRLLACADDTKLVDEISNTNNCRASTLTFTVNPGTPTAHPLSNLALDSLTAVQGTQATAGSPTPSAKPSTTLTVRDTIGVVGVGEKQGTPSVDYVLSRAPGPDDDVIRLHASTVGTPVRTFVGGKRKVVTKRKLVLPSRIPPGPWYLLGCVHHARNDDSRFADDCRSTPLTIDSSPATLGPKRPAGPR